MNDSLTLPVYDLPVVIAEIGCNHMGDMEIAKEMIKVAASFCKVDYVKFQKRTPRELLSEAEYNAPHPNPHNSFGSTYGAHREFLEFDIEQHRNLIETCKDEHVGYATSVWDITSAREIISLQPDYIKIPSASNLDFEVHQALVSDFKGDIHVSLGMTTLEEEQNIVDFYSKNSRGRNLVLYSCTSGYPVAFDDISLLEIVRLRNLYEKDIKAVGFSGHHLGIAIDLAAYTLGARYIERHFTLDRTWKGTDHAASLEPDGMRRLVRDLQNTKKALTYKRSEILEVEDVQRKKLKRKI